ncbi:STAS domain-containing protein [Bacillus badius]|uniref:RsbR, positive regulator of sigma-B n=1 Tax=Bacillus badius TaxID=1455 RepID=A0ABR5B1A0_BACBA|nr:STAS domain-containing protein [Bacillus badius]KIL80753.1 RsbR, positive regulator of sigma-B [Bacillus badius]MED4715319.1 STAS domain-containing protein [Bacillus badius]
MCINQELYEFLLDKTWGLTEEWYRSLDKSDSSGVYASEDPQVVQTVKEQNHEFHKRFCKLFISNNVQFFDQLKGWIVDIAKDEEHLRTPIYFILREFFRTQEQYLDLINEFYYLHKEKYSEEEGGSWIRITIQTFNQIITWFTEEYHKYAESKLKAQQEMINELSSPVISLNEKIALLPLVGDIDTARAKFLLENTLVQCADKRVDELIIDLSGVPMVDTMVAHQIFQLIEALDLIGVKTTISGIRPEIAQTAVQLGLNFNKIPVTSTLSKALKLNC